VRCEYFYHKVHGDGEMMAFLRALRNIGDVLEGTGFSVYVCRKEPILL
jgi:hypothetical protein